MRRDGIIMSITGDRHDIQRANISALCRAGSGAFFLELCLEIKCAARKMPKGPRVVIFYSQIDTS